MDYKRVEQGTLYAAAASFLLIGIGQFADQMPRFTVGVSLGCFTVAVFFLMLLYVLRSREKARKICYHTACLLLSLVCIPLCFFFFRWLGERSVAFFHGRLCDYLLCI